MNHNKQQNISTGMMNNNYVIVIIECLLLDVILTARNDNDNGFEKENNGITNKQKKR